jgi:hypothetical protein
MLADMIRIQILVDVKLHARVKRLARRTGFPLAEFCRRSLQEMVARQVSKPWMAFAGLVNGRPGDSSSVDDASIVGTGRQRGGPSRLRPNRRRLPA